MLTITLMAGGSMAIALLPTFDQAGWLAPILLLAARIAQGMSLGGEVSNASAYLAEIAPPERRGRCSAFFYLHRQRRAARLAARRRPRQPDERRRAGEYGWRIRSSSAACSVWSASGCAATWPRPSTSRRARRRRRRSSTR